jgi:hypothetical protein
MSELSGSDIALLSSRDNDGMFGGDGAAFFWVFALLILAGGFGNYGNNGNNCMPGGPGFVTQAELSNSLSNQTIQNQLQQIALSTQNNNYETAQLINQQSELFMSQNNTNQINVLQGFNQVTQQLAQLGYQMDQCCCSIKTQMLQDKLDSTRDQLTVAQNTISNANQSQYLLGTMGRWIGWNTTGTQSMSTT